MFIVMLIGELVLKKKKKKTRKGKVVLADER